MRRAWALASFLLLATPTALAQSRRVAVDRGALVVALLAMSVVALVLLGLALLAAARAKRPRAPKPPRKTFDHGHRIARQRNVATIEEALQLLATSPVGDVTNVAPAAKGYQVTVARKRHQPCPQTAGYLVGIFESAWAHEVRMSHAACEVNKAATCTYLVEPDVSVSGRPAAAASTPGSASERRRSAQARAGGG